MARKMNQLTTLVFFSSRKLLPLSVFKYSMSRKLENDDGREIVAFMQTFVQCDSLEHVAALCRRIECSWRNDRGEQRRRSRLFNVIGPRDELKVKTLTNTAPSDREESERRILSSFFLLVSRTAHHWSREEEFRSLPLCNSERERWSSSILIRSYVTNQGGHVQTYIDSIIDNKSVVSFFVTFARMKI